jgi:hypothetical protein
MIMKIFPHRQIKVPSTHPTIFKRSKYIKKDAIESTPIVYQNKLLLVCFDRPAAKPYGYGWTIYELLTDKIIASGKWDYGLGCAFVKDNHIHLFGSSQWDQPNGIFSCELNEEYKMAPIQQVWKSEPNQSIYNTSVCADEDGFIMAYEVREPNTTPFSIRFLKSKDLLHWTPIGNIFHPDIYAACPTVRFINNWYYILYLRSYGKYYVMSIARTRNFIEYEDFNENPHYPGNYQVVSSLNTPHEGINNSDVDLVEFENKLYIMYADGDQRTWGNLRLAIYLGTFDKFIQEFWPTDQKII